MSYPVQPPGVPPAEPPPPGYYYAPPVQQQSASGLAIATLILGLMSWVFGGIFCAIPAIICGKMEMNAIAEGRSPPAGKTLAQVGFWAGVAHIVFLILIFCVVGIFLVFGIVAAGASSAGSSY
jgi:hypothetical protein